MVWLSTDSAMYFGIVYRYLPFMILPLYATLSKMDAALLEAAERSRRVAASGVLAGDVAVVVAGGRRGLRCCVSFRSPANSSFPICSRVRTRR